MERSGFRSSALFSGAGPWSRRDLLRVGSLTMAGALLPDGAARAAVSGSGAGRAESVLILWMAGGVTHHESFDPKPDAPEAIRGR